MINIAEILAHTSYPSLELVARTLDEEALAHPIDKLNWPAFGYSPTVSVRLAYNSCELFAKFTVAEKYIRATHTENNSKVCTDSCCELFISPDGNDCYYNIEISCIGTLLMGYRKVGNPATRTDAELMQRVRRHSTLGNRTFDTKNGNFSWELTVAIPLQAFFMHQLSAFKGRTFTANIYKCGDELPEPHYLSLFPIVSEKPAFHRPDCFGKLYFE